jgi:hypothetical protein
LFERPTSTIYRFESLPLIDFFNQIQFPVYSDQELFIIAFRLNFSRFAKPHVAEAAIIVIVVAGRVTQILDPGRNDPTAAIAPP